MTNTPVQRRLQEVTQRCGLHQNQTRGFICSLIPEVSQSTARWAGKPLRGEELAFPGKMSGDQQGSGGGDSTQSGRDGLSRHPEEDLQGL